MKRIFFFDIDGTLLDHNNGLHHISNKTKYALDILSRENIIIIASGRSKCMLDKEILSLPINGFLLANGAYCEIDNKVLFSHAIEKTILNRIKSFCLKRDLVYYFECRDKIYTSSLKHDLHLAFNDAWGISFNNNVYSEVEPSGTTLINTGMIVCHNFSETNGVFDYLKDIVDLRRHNNYPSFDFTPFNLNKGSGVKQIMQFYNIKRENAFAFGDGYNDLEMLNAVSNSVAMGNATPSLKQLAKTVTDSVSQEGIYNYLVKNHLI